MTDHPIWTARPGLGPICTISKPSPGFSSAALATLLILAPSMAKRRTLVAEIVWPSCEDGKPWDVISFETPKDEIGSFRFGPSNLGCSNVESLGCFFSWCLKHLVVLAATRTYQTSERMSWIAWRPLGIVTCLSQCLKNSLRVSWAKIWMKISGSFSVKVVTAFASQTLEWPLFDWSISLSLSTLSNSYHFWPRRCPQFSFPRDLWR